jgi:hypothetical protein
LRFSRIDGCELSALDIRKGRKKVLGFGGGIRMIKESEQQQMPKIGVPQSTAEPDGVGQIV